MVDHLAARTRYLPSLRTEELKITITVMALANNYLESRSDAFKITVHVRRPIAIRTNTIGPWLDALTFLTWLSALTNSCLVYLFRPVEEAHLSRVDKITLGKTPWKYVMPALLITLTASHGYLLLRVLVAHIVERMVWTESADVKEWQKSERDVKAKYLKGLEGDIHEVDDEDVNEDVHEDTLAEEIKFWEREEGFGEIQKIGKHD
jgi:anoctamin-10